MAFTANELTVVDLFVAAYGRAPTKSGLDFFVGKMENDGWTAKDIANYMFDTAHNPEAATRYPDSGTLDDKINTVFQHVLGRAVATTEGMNYWKAKFDDSNYTMKDLVFDVLNVAKTQPGDSTTIANKEAVVEYFLEKVPADSQAGHQVHTDSVTADTSTVVAAKNAVDDLVPADFELTTGKDDIVGTANDDLIKAEVLTLNDGDKIDGGAGNDTMSIETSTDMSDAVTIKNVENIKINSLGTHNFNFTNVSDVKTIENSDSTGNITINNLKNIVKVIETGSTSKTTLNFTANALAGTTDGLEIDLNSAVNADVATIAGFESVLVNLNGNSSLKGLSIPGVQTAVFKGSGALTVANNTLDAMNTLVFKESEKLTLGNMTNVTLLDAKDNTEGVVAKIISPTTGFATDTITLNSAAAVITGSGNDNINVVANTGTNTVKLGAGNDKLVYDETTEGNAAIFGGDGDDTINASAAPLENTDVVKGEAGTDTLILSGNGNAMYTYGIEKLNLSGATTVNATNMDQKVDVDAQVKAAGNAFTVTNLMGGSTFKTSTAAGTALAQAGAIDVEFKAAEDASTLDIATGMANGALKVVNVKNITADFGYITNLGTNNIDTTGAETLTINAEKAFAADDIVDSGATDTLATITATGKDALTVDDMTSTALKTVTATAAKALSVGTTVNSNKLESVTLKSTASSVASDNIGANTVTSLKTVDIDAKKAVTVGAIQAKDLGTVKISSADANIQLADSAITATDSDGFSVDLSAATTIHGTTSATTAATVQNTGGNITAKLSGAASALVNFTTVTSGHVESVDASTLKGGLTTTITNVDGAASATNATTVSLGAKLASTSNTVTLEGSTNKLTFNGSLGADTLKIGSAADATLMSGILNGSSGSDTLDLTKLKGTDTNSDGTVSTAEAAHGAVINLGSTGVTVGNKTVAASHIVEFDGTNALSTGYDFTATNFETIKGTDGDDYLIGAASTGSTLDGGAGNDTIKGGAGVDILKGGTGNDTIYADDKDTVSDISGNDTIMFTSNVSSSNLSDDDLKNIENIGISRNTTGMYDFSVQTESLSIVGSDASDYIQGGNNNDNISSKGGNDIIRAGGGVDTVDGGDGDDVFVILGTIGAGDYTEADVTSDTGAYKLGLASLIDTGLATSDSGTDGAGETYTGGAGTNKIEIWGQANITKANLSNISSINTHSDLTISATQLQTLYNQIGNSIDLNLLDDNSTIHITGITPAIGLNLLKYFSTGIDSSDLSLLNGSPTITFDMDTFGQGNITYTIKPNDLFDLNGDGIVEDSAGENSVITIDGRTNNKVNAGDGDDIIVVGSMTSSVTVDGGTNNQGDVLVFADTNGATDDLDHVTNIEVVSLWGSSANIKTVDNLVANGTTLTVDASTLSGGNLTFDGSSETNGNFTIIGSSSNDSIKLGAGDDLVSINASGDTGSYIYYDVDNSRDVNNDDIIAGSFDVINSFTTYASNGNSDADDIDISNVNNLSSAETDLTLAANTYQIVIGTWNSSANTFTVDSNNGTDTFVAFDDGSNDVGIVLLGVTNFDASQDFGQ